jgi:hypothetical protein
MFSVVVYVVTSDSDKQGVVRHFLTVVQDLKSRKDTFWKLTSSVARINLYLS